MAAGTRGAKGTAAYRVRVSYSKDYLFFICCQIGFYDFEKLILAIS